MIDEQGVAAPAGSPDDGVEHVIVLDNVRKEFGSFVAVERADFAIRRGEFFSLLGPSGCGKTTLLKMIAGFEQPTLGRILLEGADVSRVPPYQRNVNTVFQQYALFPHMTVLDNVAFGLRAKKVPAGEARRRAHGDARRSSSWRVRQPSLQPALRRPAAARRARPRARQPAGRAAARRAARGARPQAPRGDADRAQADPARGRHHVHLRHPRPGRGAHDERPDRGDEPRPASSRSARPTEIYDAPASIFVAGFIGSANLLPGTLDGRGEPATPVAVLDSGERRRAARAPVTPATAIRSP